MRAEEQRARAGRSSRVQKKKKGGGRFFFFFRPTTAIELETVSRPTENSLPPPPDARPRAALPRNAAPPQGTDRSARTRMAHARRRATEGERRTRKREDSFDKLTLERRSFFRSKRVKWLRRAAAAKEKKLDVDDDVGDLDPPLFSPLSLSSSPPLLLSFPSFSLLSLARSRSPLLSLLDLVSPRKRRKKQLQLAFETRAS